LEPKVNHEKLQQLKQGLAIRRKEYVKAKTMVNAIDKIIIKHELEPGHNHQEIKDLKEVYSKLELADLSSTLIMEPESSVKASSSTSRFLKESLERELSTQCSDLISGLEFPVDDDWRRLDDSHFSSFPEVFRTEFQSLKKNEAERENSCCVDNTQVLSDSVKILEKIVEDLRPGVKNENLEANLLYNSAKFKTLTLKIKCLELEIMASTYNSESVGALKSISKYLKSTIARVKEEIEDLTKKLAQFKSVGPEFDDIIGEFDKIKNQIEVKKWELAELSKNNS